MTPTCLNNKGLAAGWAFMNENSRHAFYYDGVTTHDLGALPGYKDSEARGINDLGEIVGMAMVDSNLGGLQGRAVRWRNGVIEDMGSVLGGEFSALNDINNKGQMVGWSSIPGGGTRSLVVKGAAVRDLTPLVGGGSTEPHAINEAGAIVGYAGTNPFRVTGSAMNTMDPRHGGLGIAYAVNSRGDVAGFSQSDQAGGYIDEAWLYRQGVLTRLGTLPGFVHSTALGIGDTGEVVGYVSRRHEYGMAFLYENGAMKPLADCLPEGGGWKLSVALAINSRGQILVEGSRAGWGYSAILTPVATYTPAAQALAVAGGLLHSAGTGTPGSSVDIREAVISARRAAGLAP